MSRLSDAVAALESDLAAARKRIAALEVALHGPGRARPPVTRPRIVALIGSTRLRDLYELAAWEESGSGRIVLTPAFPPRGAIAAGRQLDGADALDAPTKRHLDELHLRRIDLADEVLVLGDGDTETASMQIDYAARAGKAIRYWHDEH